MKYHTLYFLKINVSSAAVVIGTLSAKIIALVLMIGPNTLNALHAGKFRNLLFRC